MGLNAAGTAAIPNRVAGIEISAAEDTEVGGPAPGAGNVISGTQAVAGGLAAFPAASNGAGIVLQQYSPGTVIQGNRIGTNEAGTEAIPNQGSGVFLLEATATIVGNQISGNAADGVSVYGSSVPNGLAGLWTADGTTYDGFGADGTLIGGATYAPALSAQAFSFDGVSGAFQDSPSNGPPAGRILYSLGGTMEAWIKTTAPSGTIMTDGGGVDTQTGMGLFLQGGHLVAIGSKGTAGQFNFQLTSPGAIDDGQWHLVAVTWDGATDSGGVTLYVDGAAVATGTALATTPRRASSLLSFGGDPNLPLPYYTGLIDEVGIYSLPLAAGDLSAIYSLRGLAQSTASSTITANLIGTNATGTAALANGNDGVNFVGTSFDTVGGTTSRAGNLISGNAYDGVEINGSGATGNLVAGNFIGTDTAGTAALANGNDGVEIDTSASANTIGGTTAGARNVISGNAYAGVEINAANDNLVEGNFIGTDTTGTVAIANNTETSAISYIYGGIAINTGASGNTVGGLTATPGSGAGNLISGNTNAGVRLWTRGTEQPVRRQPGRHRCDR